MLASAARSWGRAAAAAAPRRIARGLSTPAGNGSSRAETMDQIATAAVIGGVYCGAFLWLYRDEAEKPKREAEGGAGGLAGSGHGLETIIGELYTIRDRLDAMDQTSRWMAGGCRKGPLIVVGTGGGSDKVHTLRISPDRQLLVPTAEAVTVAQNPSFVSASADRSVVYAIGEGVATALAVDHDKGELAPLGEKQSANGAGTAFIEPDGANKHVLVANYVGGSVCVLPVREDGSLGPATDAKAHTPRSPPKPALADRQAEAHPHSVRVDPWTKRWALVPDLGKDTCYVYAYDGERGVLAGAESNERHFRTREGAGPRHLDFSAAAPGAPHRVYLLNELDATLNVLALDDKTGKLEEQQTVSLLPYFVKPDRRGHCGSADVHVHPNGKFLYASNRTNHSLAIFAIAPETGHLSLLKHVECGGRTPRQFQISPSGDFLVVANQASSDLATFCIDQATGMLSAPTITPVPDSPRCVCIIEEPAAKKAPLSD